ncbi:MAG: tetratricopeptide repeat protein [Melioribacteraceae bacterium]|nr:tetratricopeptide repeat protein [Melioribacteraceae bacterium]MDD3558401.1 tetratricopeptide repeat protein [Melioribacteraceae bacterium]
MKRYIIFSIYLTAITLGSVFAQVNTRKEAAASDSTDRALKAEQHVINGALAEMNNNYAEAILEYQDALKLDPQPGIHYSLAKNYYKIGKLAAALNHSQSSVEMDPDNTEYLGLLATIYSHAGEIDSAAAAFEKIISIDSTDVTAYYNLASIYESDKPLKALEIYNHILDFTGPDWAVLVKIADLNERLGDIPATIKTLEDLLGLNPSSLELHKLLIESLIKNKQFDKAIEKTDEVIVLFPEDLNLIEFRANALVQKGDWKEGAAEYKKLVSDKSLSFNSKVRIAGAFIKHALDDSTLIPIAHDVIAVVDKDSSDWQIKAMIAELYGMEGKDSLAVDQLKAAINLAEWNSDIWVKLGVILFESGRFEDAAQEMSAAVKKFPNDYFVNFILGFSKSQLNLHEDAQPYLQKAVILNPNDPNVLSVYAFTLNQLKREDEALSYIKKALRFDPDNSQLLGMAGMIYDNKEMWAECDSSYERALRLDPESALILNNYAYSLSERGIQLERALNMVQKSIEQDPENSSYLDTIGWVYYKLGEYNKAESYILKAIEIDENNATLLDHLGDIYLKQNKLNKAIEMWKKAQELDPENENINSKIGDKKI